jgi:hypothetical protein
MGKVHLGALYAQIADIPFHLLIKARSISVYCSSELRAGGSTKGRKLVLLCSLQLLPLLVIRSQVLVTSVHTADQAKNKVGRRQYNSFCSVSPSQPPPLILKNGKWKGI